MLNLLDGPCKGSFLVKRAPEYLRAVIDGKGEANVLDLVDDTPEPTEKVHVYHIEGTANWFHLLMSPRSKSGWYMMANYRHMPEVDGEKLRDNTDWQKWAMAHFTGVKGVECPVDKKECDKVLKTCCSCPRNPKGVG